jgi:hypothetical protein
MAYDVKGANVMLDALGGVVVRLALHTGDPGAADTAANELVGGGYARQTPTWAAAAAGSKALSGSVPFSVPAVTITWVSGWNAAGTIRYFKKALASSAVFGTAGTFTLTAGSFTLT